MAMSLEIKGNHFYIEINMEIPRPSSLGKRVEQRSRSGSAPRGSRTGWGGWNLLPGS